MSNRVPGNFFRRSPKSFRNTPVSTGSRLSVFSKDMRENKGTTAETMNVTSEIMVGLPGPKLLNHI